MKKLLTGLGGALVLVLGVAAPAWAHIEPTVEEAPAGGFVTFALTVPHGCDDDSGTTKLEVQMPEGIEEVTPQFIAGWDASVEDGTDGLVVTWEGGPLPHDQFLQFGLSLQMPDAEGETVEFPTIQTCESGASTNWTESTPEGGEEPEHPAPAITLTAAGEEGHDHGEEAEGGPDENTQEAAPEAGPDEGTDEEDSDTLAVIALIVGAAGLLVGGYAVVANRREG